jgi:hypothetical protein
MAGVHRGQVTLLASSTEPSIQVVDMIFFGEATMDFHPHRAIALICLLMTPAVSSAGTGYRIGLVGEIQADAAAVGGLTHISQAGGWQGGAPDCPLQWAYFDPAANPHFMAIVLSARMAGKALRVYVDDALAKSGGFCQIKFLAVEPD